MALASKGCFHGFVSRVRAFVGIPAVLVVLASATGLACGPSFQAIYEGNTKFEHCYALEERPQIPMDEKAECWHEWSSRYTYGQTRDRIHYATARYVALSQSIPTDEALMMAAPGVIPRTSIITAPSPTNAFVPPPKVLGDVQRSSLAPAASPKEASTAAPIHHAGVESSDAGAADPLPSSDCSEACGASFRACKAADCDNRYRVCMRGCMKP